MKNTQLHTVYSAHRIAKRYIKRIKTTPCDDMRLDLLFVIFFFSLCDATTHIHVCMRANTHSAHSFEI